MLLVVLAAGGPAWAQDRRSLGWAAQDPIAPHFEMEYVSPEVHRWYAPADLWSTYVQPWYEVDTRYSEEFYQRYVSQLLEGDEFYDILGNAVGRGWMVYSWTQTQPVARGSSVVKLPMKHGRTTAESGPGFNAYESFFNRLVIAADNRGRAAYRLTIGDEISTCFTPLTFWKPRFNGVRLDYTQEWYDATLLLSRVSDPNGVVPYKNPRGSMGDQSDVTHLMGGHAQFHLPGAARLGLTYVNAHNAQTTVSLDQENPLRGTLTSVQNQPVGKLWVRLRDDSPEDGKGGAVLLAHDLVLADTSGKQYRASQIGLVPQITGGVTRAGALVADGSDAVVLEYDLAGLDHEGLNTKSLAWVSSELTVADDYRVEMASDLQTDAQSRQGSVVYLPVCRAAGNVQDRSNVRVLRLDYGLPVADELMGLDWDLVHWAGLSWQGELVLNRQYGRYPNPKLRRNHLVTRQARAGYTDLAYQHLPWTLYLEGFSIDDAYSTSYWLNQRGSIAYRSPIPELYEFVEDDDDRNGVPEWTRPYQFGSEVAWPGQDENSDFLNDFNENYNLIPDYEEPFLRFRCDRPEFLFGMDMNYNGTIDRFENDELPDYPYKKDHRGYNGYARVQVEPDLNLVLGRQQAHLMSGDGHTRAWYLLGTWSLGLAGGGRVRLAAHASRVHDDIPDDLVQWVQPVDSQGQMQDVPDPLPAQNTWVSTLYGDCDQRLAGGLRLQHRAKWQWWWQQDSTAALAAREARGRSGFAGLIDKAEWSIPVGLATLQPRWKSELRYDRPFSQSQSRATSLEETAILLWTQPVMAERVGVTYFPRYGRQLFDTELQLGLETSRFWMLEGQRGDIDQDYFRWTGIAQLTNRVAYQGYQLVTRAGLRVGAWHFARRAGQSTSLFFMTMNAGLH